MVGKYEFIAPKWKLSLFCVAFFAYKVTEPTIYRYDIIGTKSLTAALIIIIFGLLCLYIWNRYAYWARLGVQCPKPTFIVGQTLQRFGITKPAYEFYDEMYYGYNGKCFCGFYDFLTPGLIVGDLQLIRSILYKDFDSFANRRTLGLSKVNPIANDMLSNATGDHWKNIRTKISPTFTSVKMKQLFSLICERADVFTQTISDLGDNMELETRKICGQLTMDTIASCAFGIQCKAQDSDSATFAEMASRIFVMTPARAIKIMILLLASPLAEALEFVGVDFTSAEFKFFQRVVSDTLRIREESGIRRGDFLDLMKDTHSLSETTMTAQSILFLLAGYDNTANTLSFVLHLLAIHPGYQDMLREEMQQANQGTSIDFETVKKMPLLDAVIKETLRLYPVSQTLERICTKDYVIPGTEILIRKDQPIIMPLWSIHRDPQHWKSPNSFQPERFLNKNVKENLAYLPFGGGPRKCIGENFTIFVIKVGLCKILQRYRVMKSSNTIHPPPLEPRGFLSLKTSNGLPLLIQPL